MPRIRLLYLFAHWSEDLSNRALAKVIGDERWNKAAYICVD
jgi:hypothetical protein